MRFTALTASALFALTLAAARAQEAPSPTGPPPKSNAPPPQQEDENNPLQTLKIGTNLVNVYFSARDKQGYVTDLTKEDCLITEAPEHGKPEPQVIKNFTQEKKLPLTIGILLDTSGSQMNVLPLEKDSGAEFLRDVLTPRDEAFLISFDINIDLLAEPICTTPSTSRLPKSCAPRPAARSSSCSPTAASRDRRRPSNPPPKLLRRPTSSSTSSSSPTASSTADAA